MKDNTKEAESPLDAETAVGKQSSSMNIFPTQTIDEIGVHVPYNKEQNDVTIPIEEPTTNKYRSDFIRFVLRPWELVEWLMTILNDSKESFSISTYLNIIIKVKLMCIQ